jgi:hypothetical protein
MFEITWNYQKWDKSLMYKYHYSRTAYDKMVVLFTLVLRWWDLFSRLPSHKLCRFSGAPVTTSWQLKVLDLPLAGHWSLVEQKMDGFLEVRLGLQMGITWYNNGEVSPHKLGYHLHDYSDRSTKITGTVLPSWQLKPWCLGIQGPGVQAALEKAMPGPAKCL